MTLKELAGRRLEALVEAEHRLGRNPARDVSPPRTKVGHVKRLPGPRRDLGDLGRVIACLGCAVPEELDHLSFEEFAAAGRIIEGGSGPDGAPLVFASDNASPDPCETRLVYRARELRALHDLPATEARTLHRLKRSHRVTLEAN